MKRWIVVIGLAAGLAAVAQAQPMRCGTRLINPGDNMDTVLELCGQPDNARTWTEVIPGGDDDEGMMDAARIPMAEWLYADDPDQFVNKVIFRNGIVQEIKN